MAAKGEGIPPLTMASTIEAIIGAVYIDGGMKPIPTVMRKLGLMPTAFRRIMFKNQPIAANKISETTRTDLNDKSAGDPKSAEISASEASAPT